MLLNLFLQHLHRARRFPNPRRRSRGDCFRALKSAMIRYEVGSSRGCVSPQGSRPGGSAQFAMRHGQGETGTTSARLFDNGAALGWRGFRKHRVDGAVELTLRSVSARACMQMLPPPASSRIGGLSRRRLSLSQTGCSPRFCWDTWDENNPPMHEGSVDPSSRRSKVAPRCMLHRGNNRQGCLPGAAFQGSGGQN